MLRAALLCSTAASARRLTRWDGEVVDAAALSRPVLSDELIAAVNGDAASTWVAGRGRRFENVTVAAAKALMGTLHDADAAPARRRPLTFADIPDEFDWRTDARAASCPSVKEIRDQANCGSCWAFGAVEAMTDRICIASGGKKNVHLSTQDVTSCDKGDMDDGCSGGVPSSVYDYYASTGIVSGGQYGDKSGCWSYQLAPCAHHSNSSSYPACPAATTAPKCAKKCTDNAALTWAADKHHGKAGYPVCAQPTTEKECAVSMAQEIYQNGPITAGFLVHQSFVSYKSGVYQSKKGESMLGGHGIKLIGYGNENGVPYWLAANSWNTDWAGLGGFFKIIRGASEGMIESPYMNGGPYAGEPKL